MTALAAELLWWVLGTCGVAGLVAFWFLAPTAAQLTLQAVIKLPDRLRTARRYRGGPNRRRPAPRL
jgi:hypothetical protein